MHSLTHLPVNIWTNSCHPEAAVSQKLEEGVACRTGGPATSITSPQKLSSKEHIVVVSLQGSLFHYICLTVPPSEEQPHKMWDFASYWCRTYFSAILFCMNTERVMQWWCASRRFSTTGMFPSFLPSFLLILLLLK